MEVVRIVIIWCNEYQAGSGEEDLCDSCAVDGRRDRNSNNTDPVVKLARSVGFSRWVEGRP